MDDERKASARELEREEHEQACEAAIALRDVTYGRERSALEKRVEAQAMSLCLEEVPPTQVLPLMHQEIQNRTNPYPPKAPDLLRRWRGEEWTQSDGKAERVVVANASAYQPLQPTANELAFRAAMSRESRPALPEPVLPEPENSARARWRALGEKLDGGGAADFISNRDLLFHLHRQCRMAWQWDADAGTREAMLAFGRWLLKRHPRPTIWDEDLAREEWARWQQEKSQKKAQEEL